MVTTTDSAENPTRSDRDELLLSGGITIAQYVGLSKAQLYAIANQGYQLFTSGKYEEARQIYAGLVVADPFDSVFHCHLGATLWRLGDFEKAFEEYDLSLRFNFANVDALAGRGELNMMRGQLQAGIDDLQAAINYDEKGEHDATIRARAILVALKDEMEKQQAAEA